jgi:hypothetical protein
MTVPATTSLHSLAVANQRLPPVLEPSEQQLIQELYSAIRLLVFHFGSQNATARALGISSPTLTRASPGWLKSHTTDDRLPRPHRATLRTLARCHDENIRRHAEVLLKRRGIDIDAV